MDERGFTLIELLVVVFVIGIEPGVVTTITSAGAHYTAAQASDSGTTFTIARLASGYAPTCDRPGEAGCRSDSSW